MAIYNDLGRKISGFGKNMKKKQEDLSATMKLNNNIRSLDASLKNDYQLLGKMYFDSSVNGEIDNAAVTELIAKITKTRNRLDSIEKQVQQMKGNMICPQCNSSVPKDAKFCMNCGYCFSKETKNSIPCPNCGASVEEGSVFCQECGTNLSEAMKAVNKKAEPDAAKIQACPVCGAPFEAGQLFCSECGFDIRRASSESPVENSSENVKNAEKKPNEEKKEAASDPKTLKTCPECGHTLADEDSFCDQCGYAMGREPADPTPGSSDVPSADEPAENVSGNKSEDVRVESNAENLSGIVEKPDEELDKKSDIKQEDTPKKSDPPIVSVEESTDSGEEKLPEKEEAVDDAAHTKSEDGNPDAVHRICPKCGKKFAADDNFCDQCGTKLTDSSDKDTEKI